ncbi:unnamed protein product, partial [Closterium sp. NIES-53]
LRAGHVPLKGVYSLHQTLSAAIATYLPPPSSPPALCSQNVSRLAKACASADTACSRCAFTLSAAAAALARYSPAVAARTAARGSAGNATMAAGEPTTVPSEAVMDDCARVIFVRVAQAQSWRAAPGLVTLQLDCPIV